MTRHAKNAAKLATLALLFTTLQGCVLIEMPLDRERWGRLLEGAANDCPDLTGTFRAVGEATETRLLLWFLPVQWRRKSEQEVRLDRDLRLLLDESRSRALAIDGLSEIAFAHMDAAHLQLTLHYETARMGSKEPETLTFVRRPTSREAPYGTIEDRAYEFNCDDGMLVIGAWTGERRYRDPSLTDSTIELGRLSDGALMVHVGRFSRPVPLLYYFWGSRWHRYEEVSSTGDPVQAADSQFKQRFQYRR
jgi:hypothetical protein